MLYFSFAQFEGHVFPREQNSQTIAQWSLFTSYQDCFQKVKFYDSYTPKILVNLNVYVYAYSFTGGKQSIGKALSELCQRYYSFSCSALMALGKVQVFIPIWSSWLGWYGAKRMKKYLEEWE